MRAACCRRQAIRLCAGGRSVDRSHCVTCLACVCVRRLTVGVLQQRHLDAADSHHVGVQRQVVVLFAICPD